MKIALIGMSGVGKSYWSKILCNNGFRIYSCDDLIADRLGFKLGEKDKSTLNLANWMGKPYSAGYLKAESSYLELEEEVMNVICAELENCNSNSESVVVDTTGSFIYLNNYLIERLRKLVRTVHLNLPIQKYKDLFETYLVDPKPLIWKGKYLPKKNESQIKTLRRCYSELVSFRNEKYAFISDCELDYSFHHCLNTTLKDFLQKVKC